MSKHVHVSQFEPPHVSLRQYVGAFISCLILTMLAYQTAMTHSSGDTAALIVIGIIAVAQCAVQLRRFLHLGEEFTPKWKLWVFITMLSIGVIIVVGSVWIMNNLNYRMMSSPAQVNEYVEGQDGL